MAIKLGKYNVCILDLLTDSRTGKLSASKLWLHIGNGILSYVMLTHEAADWELMATYGAVVAGSYVGIIFFKLRWGNPGGNLHSDNGFYMLESAQPEDEPDTEKPRAGNKRRKKRIDRTSRANSGGI